ncbi:MAG: transaldolase [Gemmatimonadetes bacterium]|nr:transaldolase [Gemmatimonadota bacterium]
MSRNLYEQLSDMTVVVADTGDLHSIGKFKPRDATTNPSLITAAAQMKEYSDVVDAALRRAGEEFGNDPQAVVGRAIDRLSVEFGTRILNIIAGRVSTEVDARLSYDMQGTIAKARELIGYYEEAGVDSKRVLIKIASTWEGICAGEQLEKDGIHCNLTLLFGLHQAVACAEAGITLVSPFVGRILDWYKNDTGRDSYPPHLDPGVVSVTRIYNYYKRFGYKTEVMGASFRNLDEICELAGCDLLTIAPKFLSVLQETVGELPRKLDPERAASQDIEKFTINAAAFRRMHEQDRMAREKLSEGIAGFSKAIVALERLLANRIAELDGQNPPHRAAGDVFAVYDLDGDGAITREEWAGTDAVFDALDVDGDGQITPDELAAGLGCAFYLQEGGGK